MTKLLTQTQYDLLSTLAFSSILNDNNLRPAFKEKATPIDFNDAPTDTLLLVADVLATTKEQKLDVTGGYLLGGSVVVKLSNDTANRIAWVQQQALRPNQDLMYADIGFTALLDGETKKYNLYKVHRKILVFPANSMKGKVIPLSKIDYSGKPFEPNIEFSLQALGIN